MNGTQAGQGVDFRESTKIVLTSRMNGAGQGCVRHRPQSKADSNRGRGVRCADAPQGGGGKAPDANAEMKKGPDGPFLKDFQNSVKEAENQNLERETSLELATSTLARLRSTN